MRSGSAGEGFVRGTINNEKSINALGFAHIAFAVDDVSAALELAKKNGGTSVGELVTRNYPNGKTGTFAYCRDIEGNNIELQKWEETEKQGV
ncbi:MAG: VOC family protein [Clostridiales bacterium]|jgi:predicted enzyme related to lactoylglutathione lyase|nr:VOC family protein [Clostridiales bacterium]